MKATKISRFALFAICGLVLSGCGISNNNNSPTSSGSTNKREDLRLEYFGPQKGYKPNPVSKFNEDNNEKEVLLNNDFEKLTLNIFVKNDNRYSFIDLVILNHSDNLQYVFNEGNGDYTCLSNTINTGTQWETRIEINVSNYFVNLEHENGASASLEIKELNFYNFSSEVEKANLNTEDISTLTFGWNNVAFYGQSPNRVVSNAVLIDKLNSVTANYNEQFSFEGKQYVKVLGDKHGWNIARFGNYKDMVPGKDYYYVVEKIAWVITGKTSNSITMVQQYAIPNVGTYMAPLSAEGYSLTSQLSSKVQASDYMIALGTETVFYTLSSEPTLGFCDNVSIYTLTIQKN